MVKERKGSAATLWILFIIVGTLIVSMGIFQFPAPLPELPLGDYAIFVTAVLIIVATKLVLELIKPLFRAALVHRIPHEADIFAMYQLVSYIVWAALLMTLYFLTFGGPGAFGAVGLGLVTAAFIYIMQKPLLNLVGWGILVTRRLYKLGDRIEINGVRGYVTNISLMNTILREFGGWMSGDSFTGRYASVPNSFVLEGNVFNYTKDTEFIWDELVVPVTYESDLKVAERYILESAEEVVGELMKNNRDLVRSKYEFADLANYMVEEPTVKWKLSDSSVDMLLVYFCPCYRRRHYKSEIIKRILDRFNADPRVALAYPHIEVVPYKSADMEQQEQAIMARLREK